MSPWNFCGSGSAIAEAGANANSIIIASGSTLAAYSDKVEGDICGQTEYDFITNYSTISASGKKLLDSAASAGIANKIIKYDPGGYNKLLEAQTILDVNDAVYRKGIDALSNINFRKKIGAV